MQISTPRQPVVYESDEADRLSNIKLEEELLQWCTNYFITMATDENKQHTQRR